MLGFGTSELDGCASFQLKGAPRVSHEPHGAVHLPGDVSGTVPVNVLLVVSALSPGKAGSVRSGLAGRIYILDPDRNLNCDKMDLGAIPHKEGDGKQIERCVISMFQIAESMGFKGDFRQWEHLLRVGD